MEIFVKKGQQRIDDPRRHPDYEMARRKGEKRWKEGKMKFENEAEKRDYLKQVASNGANVIGLPAFAPPIEIKSYISMPEQEDKKMSVIEMHELLKEQFAKDNIKQLYLLCESCRGLRESTAVSRVTLHNVSATDCFCQTCGKHKNYRLV